MLDNTEALEIYLQGLVKSKKELPPGVFPDKMPSLKRSSRDTAVAVDKGVKKVRFADH